VRLAEFGTVYRFEQSGELNGMLRVRGLTQDDAHLFCTTEQVEEEFRSTFELVKFVLASVGLDDFRIQLSKRDPNSDKYVGAPDVWDHAEATLRRVLEGSGLPFHEKEGEAAFYGPKTDFMVRDCLGREWQLGTVQLDYNLPQRFRLEYVGSDNATHQPVMIHRAPFGSMERFVGMLIEHFAAAFPLWLAPEQVRILGLNDDMLPYCREVQAHFQQAGFRVAIDTHSANVKKKIRDAQLDLVPYMLVVGPKDQQQGGVSVRDRIEGDLGFMTTAAALAKLTAERDGRVIRQVVKRETVSVGSEGGEANEY
jgi:threonyl-tRNA synthetase